MIKVHHFPPAAPNARWSVCSSELLMHQWIAPFLTLRTLRRESYRNASNLEPRLSLRIGRRLPRNLSLGRSRS